MSALPRRLSRSDLNQSAEHAKPHGEKQLVRRKSIQDVRASPLKMRVSCNSLSYIHKPTGSCEVKEVPKKAPSLVKKAVQHTLRRVRNDPKSNSKETSVSEIISKKQFEIYQQVFEDIIKQDTVYGGLLLSVKKNYEDYIDQLHLAVDGLKEQVKTPHHEGIDSAQRELSLLIKEKNDLEETLRKMTNECRQARNREKKYAKLIRVLQDKGLPVEELYNVHVKNPKPDTSDNSEQRDLPKLNVPQEPTKGFHQEFMDNYECFSESWRRQIDLQKR